jgi:hypothetical protein
MNTLEGILREELFELSVTDSAAFCSAGILGTAECGTEVSEGANS